MTVEALENKLNEVGTLVFRCNDSFKGTYKAEREDRFGKYMEIYSKGEKFLLQNDKDINSTGEVYYRINDAESLFYDGMVLAYSIARAIEDGVLEEIDEKPEVTVYSIEELAVVCK
jgi:hypothetical protein